MAAIYSIKIVSEEIARAYAHRTRQTIAYDEPIVTREQHQAVVDRLERQNSALTHQINELERRLTSVNALLAPQVRDSEENDQPF